MRLGIDHLGDRGRQEGPKCCVGEEMKMGVGRGKPYR